MPTPPKIPPGAKCFVARVEVEILFVCEDPTDFKARRKALAGLRETIDEYDERDIEIEAATFMPGGWENDSLVYGTHEGDLDAKAAVALNGPPEDRFLKFLKDNKPNTEK